jgi:hypothetical protein
MSGGHKILYWNRFINQKMVDPDFVKMWHRVNVPDERDLEREFQKGLFERLLSFHPCYLFTL